MFDNSWKIIDNRQIKDPAVNLAIEEYAVRYLDADYSYVFLYVNKPSVILGKHQNVLQEVNLRFCFDRKIPIYRRISGGGAVYHDEGNLNFSFITQHTLKNFNQYRTFLQPIVKAIARFGAALEIDERNNLRLSGKKISGNAQFTSRRRMLSHGTLLFDSDLETLKKALKVPENVEIHSRASRSIPGKVVNLKKFLSGQISIEDLKSAIIKEIFDEKEPWRYFSEDEWQKINDIAREKYESWQWNIAQSPPATVHKTLKYKGISVKIDYTLKDGILRDIEISDSSLNFLSELIEGMSLKPEEIENVKKKLKIRDSEFREKALFLINGLI